jgi:hypothetical protein
VNSLFGIVRRVVGQGDPSLTQLLWDRLAHSPQLIAQMEVRLRGPPAPEKRKRNCNSSSSSNSSSHSSSASDPAEASSTVIADAASDAAIVAAVTPAAVADAPSTDAASARRIIRHHPVHLLVGVALDQERSPWCTEHAMAVAASASLFGRYALICAASNLLNIWLQERVPTQQWPSDFCRELEHFKFRQGDVVYTVRVTARLLSDAVMACEHIRRSAGYWHIVVVSRHGDYTHSMAAIRVNFSGQIVCANSYGGRMAKVAVEKNAYVCSYLVACEVQKTTSAVTGSPVAKPPEDPDWARLME